MRLGFISAFFLKLPLINLPYPLNRVGILSRFVIPDSSYPCEPQCHPALVRWAMLNLVVSHFHDDFGLHHNAPTILADYQGFEMFRHVDEFCIS
jgi:hypothetical protein